MTDDVTALIQAANAGDAQALQSLFARVYGELKRLAHRQLAGSPSPTLNTTGLVHEAYLKLARPEAEGRSLHNRVHFFALAAKAMRQIVIDHARAKLTEKRGGADLHVAFDEALDVSGAQFGPEELVRLDRALGQLEVDEPRLANLVELRFFAGLSVGEIALMQALSERTINRDWRRAKAQLYGALHPEI